MTDTTRTLTVTLNPDWRAALRAAGKLDGSNSYQGEQLNFETPGAFFANLTELRWAIVRALQGRGPMALRELARRVERDVKRVHEDVARLVELGLIERTEAGSIECPFAEIHIDMHMLAPIAEAA